MQPVLPGARPLEGCPEAPTVTFEFLRPPDRRFTYQAEVVEATDARIVLSQTCRPSRPLYYRGEEVMSEGYSAVWFLYQGESFDIARVYRPDGGWTGYYVDVLEPTRWQGSDPTTLRPIVDLFLDIWIAPDDSYQVLDRDEFDEAVRLGHISLEQTAHAQHALARLTQLIESRTFPPADVKEFVR